MTKRITLCAAALCAGISLASAQPPPPPPPGAPPAAVNPSTVSGAISQLNYGPDGSIDGFLVSNTLVHLPRDWAMRLENVLRPGERVSVTGQPAPAMNANLQIVEAQSLRVAGRTFAMPQPGASVPYIGTGTIRQLNFGPQGEINGFVLQNGVLAQTPPFDANTNSILKPGAQIGISGFEETTPAGAAVIHLQSISVNGQTLSFDNAPLPPRPPRAGGPRPGRPGPPLPPNPPAR